MKKHLPKKCQATRIENRHGGGVPDVYFNWSGLMFWIELKTTKNNTVRLAPNQIAWNTAHSLSGGLSFILVKSLSSGDLFLFEGAQSREIGRIGLREEPLYRGSGYWDLWAAVRESGIEHLESVLAAQRLLQQESGIGHRDSGFGTPGTSAAQGEDQG